MPAVPHLIAIILLASLSLVLSEILRAGSTGKLLVPQQPRRRLEFDWALLAAAFAFILLPLLLQSMAAGGERAVEKPPSSLGIEEAILSHFVVVAVLISLIIARGKNRLSDFGINLRGWLAEVRFGGLAFLACLPFVVAVIMLLAHWRSPDKQNPLLIVLHEAGSGRTILEVVFAAVVSAPLAEELLFRVAFQGMLETRLRLAASIAIPAFVFAGVHGPYDALPLLPLALALGGLYHLRQSYVAVVTTHALFNAAFLILALWQRGSS